MIGSYWQLWFLQALLVAAILVTALLYFKVSLKKIFVLALFGYIIQEVAACIHYTT